MGRLSGVELGGTVRSGLLGLLALLVLALNAATAGADPYRLTVRGNGTDLGETPVVARLGANFAPGKYRLQARGNAPSLPAQIYQEGGASYVVFVLKDLPALRGELTFSF